MLRRKIVILLLCLVAGWPGGLGAEMGERRFVPGFDDLPLMPGLTVVGEAPVVFDKPGGRIVDMVAHGPVGQGDALAFYQQALPELGWQPLDATAAQARFRREGELLLIEFAGRERNLTVRFLLSPS